MKSGAWGGRPTCHPQTPPLVSASFNIQVLFINRNFPQQTQQLSILVHWCILTIL